MIYLTVLAAAAAFIIGCGTGTLAGAAEGMGVAALCVFIGMVVER